MKLITACCVAQLFLGSVAALSAAAPPGLKMTGFTPGVGASLQIFGVPAQTNTLEAAEDMFGGWSLLRTIQLGGDGKFNVLDTGATNSALRFYRTYSFDGVTQTFSTNAVGFVRQTLGPGEFKLIANPLLAETNTVSSLIPATNGLSVFKPGPAGYVASSYFNGWINPGMTLMPGESFFIHNSSSFNRSLAFIGTVPQVTLTNRIPAGRSFVASILPTPGLIGTDLNYNAQNGDTVSFYFHPDYVSYSYSSGTSSWSPSEPTVFAGQGFSLKKTSGTDWTNFFQPAFL